MRAVMMGRGGSLLVWYCEQDRSPRPPSAPGCAWHGEVGSCPLVPRPSWHIPTAVPLGMAQPGLGEHSTVVGWRAVGHGNFAGGRLHFGRSQMQPQSLGRAASPPPPRFPFWAGGFMQSIDGKLRHGEGRITVPTSSPCPGFHASRGSSCRCVLPPGTSSTLTHTLMVTAS